MTTRLSFSQTLSKVSAGSENAAITGQISKSHSIPLFRSFGRE
jgi:hypothetical protein